MKSHGVWAPINRDGLGPGGLGCWVCWCNCEALFHRELSGWEMDGVVYQDAKEPLSCSLQQTGLKPPALEDSTWFRGGAAKSSVGLRGLVQETAVSVFHQCPAWNQESQARLGMCWKSFCFHLEQSTILWLSTIKALKIYVNIEGLRTNWGYSSS